MQAAIFTGLEAQRRMRGATAWGDTAGAMSSSIRVYPLRDRLQIPFVGLRSGHYAIVLMNNATGLGFRGINMSIAENDGAPSYVSPDRAATHTELKVVGSQICPECAAGTADLDQDAMTDCDACQDGQFASARSTQCTDCSLGQADTDRDPSTPCSDCPDGAV